MTNDQQQVFQANCLSALRGDGCPNHYDVELASLSAMLVSRSLIMKPRLRNLISRWISGSENWTVISITQPRRPAVSVTKFIVCTPELQAQLKTAIERGT